MATDDETAAWIALRATDGIGDVAGRRLVDRFGGAVAVRAASHRALAAVGLPATVVRDLCDAGRLEAARAEVARLATLGGRAIVLTDPEYPAPLRELRDAPLVLYARGAPLADVPCVAVVGARRATPYGRDVAERFAEGLVQAGVVVVSGLARGIDAAAHRGALRGGGVTLAVLGSGVDVVYPPEHDELAEAIVASGTVLSERPLGTAPLPAHFPARNRVIAGMSRATVVVEAALKSGSLITARLALDEGREVLAVPGRVDSPLSAGCHRLIQDGAKLAGSVDDVLDELGPSLRARGTGPRALASLGDLSADPPADPAAALLGLLAAGPLHLDRLIDESGLPAADVMAHLLDLELQGRLVQLPGNQCQLVAR